MLLFRKFTIFLSLICARACLSVFTKANEQTQHEYLDPCSATKCEQDEVCVAQNDESATCVKKSNLEVKHVARREMPTFCGTEECRFGECEVLNATTFVCHCTKGVSGLNCNELDKTNQPCSSNPCFGESTCVNLPDKFVCICGAGLTGPQCKEHMSPCQCKNGGICVSSMDNTYSCQCLDGFGGNLCQYSVTPFLPCQVTGCFNDGICNINGKCQCPSEYTGIRCEQLTTTTTTTTKAPSLKLNINVCYVGICQNGGTCYQLQPNLAICMCPAGYSGPYCSLVNRSAKNGDTPVYEEPKPLTISLTLATRLTTTTTSTTPDPKQSALVCSQLVANPCRNGGTCVFSNQTRSFSCACSPTYTDPLCGTRVAFCANNPCKNGGTCNQRAGELRGNCTCPSNYGGPTCEIILTCYPNPCKNAQPCLVIGGRARCFCTHNFSQPYCDRKYDY